MWLDGELVSPREAHVSVLDHGLTVGDGVFETLRTYRGVPFAVRRHLDRLAASARSLGLVLPERALLERAIRDVVQASGLAEAKVRLTVTAGAAPLGSGRGSGPPTVVAAVAPLDQRPPQAEVVIVPWTRNQDGVLAGVKATSYAENVVALAYGRDRGADEAIFANTRGELCEGTGTNVFVASGGRLVTPSLSSGCLAGVTRSVVMKLVEVDEAVLSIHALGRADEAFLTSTTREVQPISIVDGRPLRASPGPLTQVAAAAFSALTAAELDP